MKYAIVGAGGRHQMFREAVTETHKDSNELVALCDVNEKRLALSVRDAPPQPGNGIATYVAAEFDKMIAEQKPDTVIVTVPDYLHDEYIVRALKALQGLSRGLDKAVYRRKPSPATRLKVLESPFDFGF